MHAVAPFAVFADAALLPWIAGGLVANHAALTAAGLWPRSTVLGPNMTRLPLQASGRGEVALTFDDGPDPSVTPRVLDLLEAHGANASFFCIGAKAAAAPALVRDIVARGHSVENHTMSHPSAFACLGPRGLRNEIAGAQSLLSDFTGTAPRFFRAPMGLRSPLLDPVLAKADLQFISWTRRALDGIRCEPAAALRRLLRGLRAGDVLLMHDGQLRLKSGQNGVVALQVLPALLVAIEAAGLRAVALPAACGAGSADAAGSP